MIPVVLFFRTNRGSVWPRRVMDITHQYLRLSLGGTVAFSIMLLGCEPPSPTNLRNIPRVQKSDTQPKPKSDASSLPKTDELTEETLHRWGVETESSQLAQAQVAQPDLAEDDPFEGTRDAVVALSALFSQSR